MPLHSITQYMKGQLDDLPIPGGTQTLTAYITPPTPGKLSGPLAFVGDCTAHASRESMPRGLGFKNLIWTIQIYLAYSSSANRANIDAAFPLIADAIMARLWTTTMPLEITDDTTGLVSRVMAVGEKFGFQKPRVRTVGSNQMLYYAARLDAEVRELIQA